MKLSDIRLRRAALSSDGVWIEDVPDMPGFSVRVRALSSPAAVALQDSLAMQIIAGRHRRIKSTPVEVMDYLSARRLIDVCVTDWKGLEAPVDETGLPCFDPEKIVTETTVNYSAAALEAILLEPAPDGVIVTEPAPGAAAQRFTTPDGKQARGEMLIFLRALTAAASIAERPDEDAEKNGEA